MPARIYDAQFPFLARGAHPTLSGTALNVPGAEAAKMASIDGTASLLALTGTNHAGVLEWAQPGASSLSPPTGEVVRIIAVEVVGRFVAPVTFTTDSSWIVELFDSRTGATVGAQRQSLLLPISGSLVTAIAGGLDDWAVSQSSLAAVMAANALRVRMISPGWSSASGGALSIDGMAVRIDTTLPVTSVRSRVQHVRSPDPGRAPGRGVLAPGEIAVNHSDRQLYVGDGVQDAIPYLGVRLFQPDARYKLDDIVLYQRAWYFANESTVGPGPFNSSQWSPLTAAAALQAAFATSAGSASTATTAGSATTAATATNANALANRAIDVLFWYMAPLQMPFMWRGPASSLPANWKIMNGLNGLPDARGRIVEGAANDGEVDAMSGTGWNGTTGGTTMTLDRIGADINVEGTTGGNQDVLVPNGIQSGITDPHTHSFAVTPKTIRWYWICRIS